MKILQFILLTLSIILITSNDIEASFQNVYLGEILPEIKGVDVVTNNKISSKKILQAKKILIISFWSEWSERSIEQLLYLEKLKQQDPHKKIHIVTIYTGHLDNFKLNEFIKKRNLSLIVLSDHENELAHSFGLIAVPSTIITNNVGIIKTLISGFSLTTQDKIVDSLDVLLGNRLKKRIKAEELLYRPNQKSLHFYNTAFKLFSQRAYEQAMTNLNESLQHDSLYVQPYLLQATILYQTNKFDTVLTICKKLKGIDSTLQTPLLLISKVLIQKKKYQQAIISLQDILKKDSTHIKALLLLVKSYIELQQTDNALNILNRIFTHYSNHPEALVLKGILYINQRNKQLALQSFLTAGKIIFP